MACCARACVCCVVCVRACVRARVLKNQKEKRITSSIGVCHRHGALLPAAESASRYPPALFKRCVTGTRTLQGNERIVDSWA